jgi:Dna[CI] antecedent, DciA
MRKINTLLSENSQLSALAKNVQSHTLLQQLWHLSAPKILALASHATSLNNGQLTVLANSAIVANKIKLTEVSLLSSLLTQIQNLQKKQPSLRECKVTAISVKVQVKSMPKPVIKTPRMLSAKAATSLKTFAQDLGESPLATKLNALASKH